MTGATFRHDGPGTSAETWDQVLAERPPVELKLPLTPGLLVGRTDTNTSTAQTSACHSRPTDTPVAFPTLPQVAPG